MVIRISDIAGELKVRGTIQGAKLQEMEGGADAVQFGAPAFYELTVRKNGDVVSVQGPVECTLSLTCSKCLEQFTMPVDATVDIELAPRTLMPAESELELKGEDLDVYYYEGDEVDLDPFVYEEIMLNVPIKPVCNEECRGLCETCGSNRNHEDCRCGEGIRTLLGEKLKSFLN